jgi:hypothetical protein
MSRPRKRRSQREAGFENKRRRLGGRPQSSTTGEVGNTSSCAQRQRLLIRSIVRALKGQLWAFDVAGSAKAQRILEVFSYARRRYGIELFVIDNLTKCGFDDDDYKPEELDKLQRFATAMKVLTPPQGIAKSSGTAERALDYFTELLRGIPGGTSMIKLLRAPANARTASQMMAPVRAPVSRAYPALLNGIGQAGIQNGIPQRMLDGSTGG